MKRRVFTVLLFAIAALQGALYIVAGAPLRQAREAWRSGHTPAAISVLERWRKWHVRPAEFDEALAAAYLTNGDSALAAAPLARLAGRSPLGTLPFPKLELAQRLVARGAYADFLQFDGAVHDRHESDDVALYRATALAGTGKIAEAQRQFASIRKDRVEQARYQRLAALLDAIGKGDLVVVLDRMHRPLASYNLATHQLHSRDAAFDPLVGAANAPFTFSAAFHNSTPGVVLSTGFDPAIQRAAVEALDHYRGSLVAIDTRTGDLLAMASNIADGAPGNLAVTQQYEPGSVMKVLTTLNAVDTHVPLNSVFPLDCKGFLEIDGHTFSDWAVHEQLPSINEAMATSCNVAFALLGMRIGAAQIDSYLERVGFGGKVDLGYCTGELGKLQGALTNRRAIADSSVGLGHETINALHLAMLADAVANGGVLRPPRVILRRETLLGDAVAVEAETVASHTVVGSPAAIRTAVAAMKSVVTDPRGTGRRAAVDGLTIAMKTGTAGERPYNALIMAFAPADHPRIAIGMIAEHAGPAELEGARIAHDFFNAIKPQL